MADRGDVTLPLNHGLHLYEEVLLFIYYDSIKIFCLFKIVSHFMCFWHLCFIFLYSFLFAVLVILVLQLKHFTLG